MDSAQTVPHHPSAANHSHPHNPSSESLSHDWSKFPGVPIAFGFETSFDYENILKWHEKNWTISVYISIIYLILVFVGSSWMKSRPAFGLRLPLTIWSWCLAIFSIFGVLRIVPPWIHSYQNKGWSASLCNAKVNHDDIRVQYWIWIFVLSKVIELGDTAFIILRKQKLLFLHVYHHFLTLIFGFATVHEMSSVFLWFAGMNFSVHSVMYSYYALRAMKIRIPTVVNMIITSSQILQMVIGAAVGITAYTVRSSGGPCDFSNYGIIFALVVYSSFLVLFVHFFVQTYFVKKCTPDDKSITGKSTSERVMNRNNNNHYQKNGKIE